MADELRHAAEDGLREVTVKYDLLNAATRERLREIAGRIQARIDELDRAALENDDASHSTARR